MTRLLSIISLFSIFFYACDNQDATNKTDSYAPQYQGLQGTWVRHNKEGFTLIEIKDTSHVLYYQFMDRKAESDDRYWYYRSEASMGYWNNPVKADVDIWIFTDKFRFDYKLKGDTLIEYDKMGVQGKFIKMHKDN